VGQVERGVVLAAGLGTRLRWLTHGRPKALMQVGGEPAVVHVIRALVSQGVREIAVNIHHHADQMRACLGDGSRFGCHLSISYEVTLLDSGGGVKKALELLPGDSPFVVWNADVLSDIDVQALAVVMPASCDAAIGLVPNPAHHPNGDFALERGYVMVEGREHFTFSGVSVWRAHALDGYSSGEIFSLTRPMRALIAERRCAGMLHRGRWFDIGRPRDLMLANRFPGGG